MIPRSLRGGAGLVRRTGTARLAAGLLALAAIPGCVLPDYQASGQAGDSPSGPGGAGGTSSSGPTTSGEGGATTTDTGAGGLGGEGGAITTGTETTGNGGAGGATLSTATTTSSLPPEDCHDGADNDGDSLVDCADPDCAAELQATCAPPAPAGWSHVRASAGTFPVFAPPACSTGALVTRFAGPSPSSCDACSCNWQNVQCAPPQVTCYHGNTTCGGTPDLVFNPSSSACVGPGTVTQAPAGMSSCVESAPPAAVSPGVCQAFTQQKEEMWASALHTCPAPTVPKTGCGQGVCLGAGSGAFGGPPCIVAQGDLACPAGWGQKQVVYAGGTDGRTCSACACGAPNTTCTAQAKTILFNDDTCSGNMNAMFDATCDPVGALLGGAARSIKPPQTSGQSTSTCSGGIAGGQVFPTGPHTVCCQ